MVLSLSYQSFSWLALLLVLALSFASSSSDGNEEKYNQLLGIWVTPDRILAKGSAIPPSGPSKGQYSPPPGPFPSSFGKLPKGPSIQPSGAAGEEHGTGVTSSPLRKISSRGLYFGMLPKGTPIPPSAPGRTHNAGPPET
ncbi:hypothetical protein ACFX11_009628 [Malus domestica]